MLGLSSGTIQIRFSEALCILPHFTGAAVPGLFVGCIIANLLTGAALWDVIFGSLATLIGAVFTRMLKNKPAWLSPIPPIFSNTVIIPLVLTYAYGMTNGLPFIMLTVSIGEIISCGIMGMLLLTCLKKYRTYIFGGKNF